MLRLRVMGGNGGDGAAYALLPDRPMMLGRSARCDIVIKDPGLSRRHCRLLAHDGEVRIADLGSSNGLRVNGKRVREATCRAGDRLRVGHTEFEFTHDPAAAAPTGARALLDALPTCAACGALIPASAAPGVRTSGPYHFCRACTDTELGLVLGGFRLLAPIGSGAMGRVYRAWQESLQRAVAVKVLQRALVADEGLVKRFLREAHAGGRCDHPGIVQVIDAGQAEGRYYLALEFVEGGSLGDRLTRESRLPLLETLDIGLRVAAALGHAHARGVIHRDVKPANVLLTRAGEPKVTDLGLAKCLEESGLGTLTQVGTTMGTLTYMPPEQLLDARSADARSDVYALAATLFHCATGARPYPGQSPHDYAQQIQSAPVHWPKARGRAAIPPGVRAALDRAMAKAPAARFATMDQFAAALAAARRTAG